MVYKTGFFKKALCQSFVRDQMKKSSGTGMMIRSYEIGILMVVRHSIDGLGAVRRTSGKTNTTVTGGVMIWHRNDHFHGLCLSMHVLITPFGSPVSNGARQNASFAKFGCDLATPV